jgi:hypothetical protein
VEYTEATISGGFMDNSDRLKTQHHQGREAIIAAKLKSALNSKSALNFKEVARYIRISMHKSKNISEVIGFIVIEISGDSRKLWGLLEASLLI